LRLAACRYPFPFGQIQHLRAIVLTRRNLLDNFRALSFPMAPNAVGLTSFFLIVHVL